jgi:hypothetical protein
MIIFGWGSKSKQIKIPDNKEQFIITTFGYFHIAWIWRITTNRQWYLINRSTDDKGQTITSEKFLTIDEVKQILGKDPTNLFWTIFNQSLLLTLVPLVIFTLVSGFFRPPQLNKQEIIAKVKVVDELSYQKLLQDYKDDKKTKTKIEDYRRIYTKFPEIEKRFEENKMAFQAYYSSSFNIEDYFSMAQDVSVRGKKSEANPDQRIMLTKTTVQSPSKFLVATIIDKNADGIIYSNFQILEKI